MTEQENVQRNEALRTVMDRYGIRVLEGQERDREKMPKGFSYRGSSPVVEVHMGDHSAFCRFEEIGGAANFGKERWLMHFPDWEGYLLARLLGDMQGIGWHQKHSVKSNEGMKSSEHSGMLGWLYTYGHFGNAAEDRHEWDYACRAARDLAHLFGETILGELLQACKQCDWNTDGLE